VHSREQVVLSNVRFGDRSNDDPMASLGRFRRRDRAVRRPLRLTPQASPKKTARARLTVTIVASSSRPMTGPSRFRDGVCGLSTMICERLANPFSSPGSIGTRSNGASTSVLVIGRTVTEAKVAEVVCLHHESGSGLALIALQGDRHQVPTHHAVQPVVSDVSYQASSSARRSGVSLFRMSRACRAHSLENPAARVSGTQICTGRSPAARSLSRRRCTRCVPVLLAVIRCT
jgi:hypothetical protein